jgi:hypothetical protein
VESVKVEEAIQSQLLSIPSIPKFIAGLQPLKYLQGTSALLDIDYFTSESTASHLDVSFASWKVIKSQNF